MDDMPRIIGELVDEIKAVSPLFARQIEKANARLTSLSALSLQGEDYAREYLPVEIVLHAFEKILIIIENNLSFIETISLLGITRYLFELHIWLKSIEAQRLNSIEFFMQIYEDQEKHIRNYMDRLNAEADFFDELQLEDRLPDSLIQLSKSDPKQLTPEFVRAEIAKKEISVDLKARRRFALYRRDAVSNGYGYQAHLIRSKAVIAAQGQLDQVLSSKSEFEKIITMPLIESRILTAKGKRKPWKWREEAEKVSMVDKFDFIYGYTSRLIHATPTSFYTAKKNLEREGMETFLEYCYVTLLDIDALATSLLRS